MCSTPITSARGGGEVDYPSLSFVRNSEQGLSTDEGQKLTIRLHYNPVMDEWVRSVQVRLKSTLKIEWLHSVIFTSTC